MSILIFLLCFLVLSEEKKILISEGSFRAGVSKVNATLPVGVPLAGYNHGARRVPFWPLPYFTEYTTFMTPSQGFLDPTWTKALVLDNGKEQFVFCTFDGIGSDSNLNQLSYDIAVGMGWKIPFSNIIFSSSHSHSGPGAVSSDSLWALAPATDLMVPLIQRQLATSMAQSMMQAYNNLAPAKIAVGTGELIGVTQNRRAGFSPYVKKGTIDPHLGVIRVDNENNQPIATLWNFAIHGICYGPDNLFFSSDIMGKACDSIESLIGGVALFVNADAGDVDPADQTCSNAPNFAGAPIIASAVKKIRDSLNTTNTGIEMVAYSKVFEFGPTDLNITLQRFDNCTSGGALDICTLCTILRCDLNAHLYSAWIEQSPRFTAFGFVINGIKSVVVSIPGEGLVELGWWIRNDTLDMGWDITLLAGYSNAHLGYFATPDEYDIGGYESQLTFWGIKTASLIREGCFTVSKYVMSNLFSSKMLNMIINKQIL